MEAQANLCYHQAMKMILLGDPITGSDASAFGLVTDLSDPGTVLDRAIDVASRLAAQSSSAVRLAKEAICRGKAVLLSFPLIFLPGGKRGLGILVIYG